MRLGVVAGANEYRLLERVESTALGRVYRAQHVSSGRVVVVRLLRRIARDPAAMRAFNAELPAIAALRHRNILPVESWGETEGYPSVVTPLPDAEPLADRLARDWRPDRAAALRLLRGAAAAIDHAHRMGIVHGDLEPATVLVAADGSALVAHFGLARLGGATPLPGGTGLRHGSPAHVAPERVVAGVLRPAADVYALAVIAQQLLGAVPPAAAAVVERGMDRDPAARWATCGELMDALEAALAGASAPARESPAAIAAPRSPRSDVPGLLRRLPVRAWMAAAAGLLLLVLLAVVILAGGRGAPPVPAAPGSPLTSAPPVGPRGATAPLPGAASATPQPSPSATTARAKPTPTSARTGAPASTPAATPTPTPASGLSMTVSDPTPSPGEANVTVTGHGFDHTQQYVVRFVQGGASQQIFGPASATGTNDFSNPVQIPTAAQPGPASLVACVYLTNQHVTAGCASAQVNIVG